MIGTSKLNESAIFGVGMDCANTEASVMPTLIFEKCSQFLWRQSLNSDVAQWIEHQTTDLGTAGSSPAIRAKTVKVPDVRKAVVHSSHR